MKPRTGIVDDNGRELEWEEWKALPGEVQDEILAIRNCTTCQFQHNICCSGASEGGKYCLDNDFTYYKYKRS